jgi:DNA-binding MarR family transcriptional regulator
MRTQRPDVEDARNLFVLLRNAHVLLERQLGEVVARIILADATTHHEGGGATRRAVSGLEAWDRSRRTAGNLVGDAGRWDGDGEGGDGGAWVVNLTVVDVHLLRRLAVRPSSTALLAEYLLCTHPTVRRRMAVLEGSGLIDRSPSYRDSRMNTLTLSDTGREVVQMIERAMDGLLDVIGDDVPSEHWRALLQDLDTLSG